MSRKVIDSRCVIALLVGIILLIFFGNTKFQHIFQCSGLMAVLQSVFLCIQAGLCGWRDPGLFSSAAEQVWQFLYRLNFEVDLLNAAKGGCEILFLMFLIPCPLNAEFGSTSASFALDFLIYLKTPSI